MSGNANHDNAMSGSTKGGSTLIDLVLRGGTVADGTGGEIFEADIAVDRGRIVQVGKVAARGREEIDARGKLVTPGFIDVHTHFDGQAIWSQRLAPSSWHGVTTAVMGNCGVGFAPVHDTDHDCLIELMEGVEDVPGVVMREGLEWAWGSYADYLDALERKPHDIDFCSQLPHAPLRTFARVCTGAKLSVAYALSVRIQYQRRSIPPNRAVIFPTQPRYARKDAISLDKNDHAASNDNRY